MDDVIEKLRAEIKRRKTSNDILTLVEFVIDICESNKANVPPRVLDAAARLLSLAEAPSAPSQD